MTTLGIPITTAQHNAIWAFYGQWMADPAYTGFTGIFKHTQPGEPIEVPPSPLLLVFGDRPILGGGEPPIVQESDLGSALVDGLGGSTSGMTLYIFNEGGADAVIQSVELLGGNAGFSLEPDALPAVVHPVLGATQAQVDQATHAITVVFDPTRVGPASDVLRIRSNIATGDILIPVTALGVSPFGDIRLSVANNNFGGQALSAAALSLANFATIQNVGSQPLVISSFTAPLEYSVDGLPAGFGPGAPAERVVYIRHVV
jgi:hypothetical protein